MGLVVFSGFAELTVPPTTDRKALVEAIDGLTTGHGTAIGSAMLKGLDAIAEANPNVAPVGDAPETEPPATGSTPSSPPANGFVPDIIVLLTDGANNRGIEPLDAVPYAVERQVRVYPIGFGTANPSPPVVHPRAARRRRLRRRRLRRRRWRVRRRFGGRRGFLVADEPTLKEVAKQTGGTYHGAKDADQLSKVFADLPKEVATQKQPTEITWMLAALGALLAAAAVAASMRWSPYP